MKKTRNMRIALLLGIIIILSSINISFAAEDNIQVKINNEIYKNSQSLYMEEESLMIPVREFAEGLGYKVIWNDKSREVDIVKDNNILRLGIGKDLIEFNNEKYNIDIKPIIKSGKTFIPLELLGNFLDINIRYDDIYGKLNLRNNRKEIMEVNNNQMSKDLDKYIDRLNEKENFNGSVLVAKDGEIILNNGYGRSNHIQKIDNNSQTRFGIGSITKQFTAMGIMQLYEEDKIKLEDKLSDYIEGVNGGDDINIHNLLTHSSGLTEFTNEEDFYNLDISNTDKSKVLDLVKDSEPGFKAGERFEYSNTNYLILGMIIEKISGLSYEDFLEENILKPLDMKDTGICSVNGIMPDATPYTGYLEQSQIDDSSVLTQTYSAGSMYSTVEDLYRWAKSLDTEKLVSQKTMDMIFKENMTIDKDVSYGYGWMIFDTELGKQYEHGGNTLGFTSSIGFIPDKDIVIISLVNTRLYDMNKLSSAILSILTGKDVEMPEGPQILDIDAVEYNKYIGEYKLAEDFIISILVEDDKIYAQATGQDKFEIYPQGEDKFIAKIIDATLEFEMDHKGKSIGMKFTQSGIPMYLKNIEFIEDFKEIEMDKKIYKDYIGEYKLVDGVVISIYMEDDGLYAKLTNQEGMRILPKGEDDFFYRDIDAQIKFNRKDNRVDSLIFTQNNQDMECLRIEN